MNQDLQTFKEKISRELLSKTETYWLDQIEFEITNNDLNILCQNYRLQGPELENFSKSFSFC